MALVICPDCLRAVSDAATSCVHCGRPMDAGGFDPHAGFSGPAPGPAVAEAAPAVAVDPVAKAAWSDRPRPWVRYFARYIDVMVAVFVFGALLMLFFPMTFGDMADDSGGEFVAVLLALGAWVFLEAELLSRWGTTPGKALLRVKVRNPDGSTLSYGQALRRSGAVLVRGLGLGIPLVTAITMLVARSRLLARGRTTWDRDYEVTHAEVGPGRWVAVAAIFCIAIAFMVADAVV